MVRITTCCRFSSDFRCSVSCSDTLHKVPDLGHVLTYPSAALRPHGAGPDPIRRNTSNIRIDTFKKQTAVQVEALSRPSYRIGLNLASNIRSIIVAQPEKRAERLYGESHKSLGLLE